MNVIHCRILAKSATLIGSMRQSKYLLLQWNHIFMIFRINDSLCKELIFLSFYYFKLMKMYERKTFYISIKHLPTATQDNLWSVCFWTEKQFPGSINVNVYYWFLHEKKRLWRWKMHCSTYELSSLSWTVSNICRTLTWTLFC